MKTKLGSLSEKLENIAAVHARDEIFCFSVWRCPMTFTFVHIIALRVQKGRPIREGICSQVYCFTNIMLLQYFMTLGEYGCSIAFKSSDKKMQKILSLRKCNKLTLTDGSPLASNLHDLATKPWPTTWIRIFKHYASLHRITYSVIVFLALT